MGEQAVGPLQLRPRRLGGNLMSVTLPGPDGINTIDAGPSMPLTDAIYIYNMVRGELGLRSRLGWAEWCTGLTGAADNQVRSVLPYTGSQQNGALNKLFACTSSGIWDCSASSSAPVQVAVFPNQGGDAGWGTCHAMNTPAGRFLLYTDEVNGYWVYTESTNSWTQVTLGGGAGQVSGVDPASFAHVTVWQNRVWLVQRDSSLAWYLAPNAVFGAATSFDFGPRMRAGGALVGLYNWSYDGGGGMTTNLVGVSTGGDVVIYYGTNPTDVTTFYLKGCWFLGGAPHGRRIATDFGGDTLLLGPQGVVPLSKLVIGNSVLDRSQYATSKIANLFNVLFSQNQGFQGWAVKVHPNDNSLLVLVPQGIGQNTIQLAMSFATRGWSQYRGIPMLSAEAWAGQLYFGTADGRVCVNQGYVDGITLANPAAFTPVFFSLQTAFSNLGNGRQKRIRQIRPTFITQGARPRWTPQARYRYDFTEVGGGVLSLAQGGDGVSTIFAASSYIAKGLVLVDRLPQISGVDYTESVVNGVSVYTFLVPPPAGATLTVLGAGAPGSSQAGLPGTWDNAVWDQAVWAGSYAPMQAVVGGAGMGPDISVAISGAAIDRTSLVSIDVMFDQGGLL